MEGGTRNQKKMKTKRNNELPFSKVTRLPGCMSEVHGFSLHNLASPYLTLSPTHLKLLLFQPQAGAIPEIRTRGIYE